MKHKPHFWSISSGGCLKHNGELLQYAHSAGPSLGLRRSRRVNSPFLQEEAERQNCLQRCRCNKATFGKLKKKKKKGQCHDVPS